MKNLIFIFLLVVGLAFAPIVMADTVTVTRYSGYFQSGFNGGEFTVIINDRNNPPDLEWVLPHYINGKTGGIGGDYSFQTFCVETTEYTGSNLDFEISQKAIFGQTTNGDPISIGTAWLYAQFVKGTLPGYEYTPGSGREADAKALQETIWWLEGEGPDPSNTNEFRKLVWDTFGNNAFVDNNWAYPVAVLNLWVKEHVGERGYEKQDQLVYVPEPSLLILLGIGLSAVGLAARRRRK